MYRTDKAFMRNPATAPSRIYIGSLADDVTAADLEEVFKSHGTILGLSLQRGFGFIQFETEAEAQAAIHGEHSKPFHGRKLNVRPANPDKPRTQSNILQAEEFASEKKGFNPSFEKSSGPPSLLQQTILPPKQLLSNQEEKMDTTELHDDISQDKLDMENDPFADNDGDRKQWNRGGGHPNKNRIGGRRDNFIPPRERETPVHRESGFRGRNNDMVEGSLRDRPDIQRDRVEPFLRERDTKHHDKPSFFGREDNFRDRPTPVFIPPPGIDRPERNDCEIIVVAKALTEYAEFIEQKLKGLGLVVDLLFPNEDVPIGRVLANISSRGCLYAILVMPQNEEFRSLTLNILHGISQEHRNMPIEDALILIGRNFESYIRGEKSSTVIPNPAAAMLNERHPEQIQILCNLVAENRQITTAQYDRLLKYLQERRDLQSQYEVSENGAELNAEGEPDTKQAELQNRIMNILNKSTDDPPKSSETSNSGTSGPTPLLNDPSVQKALDSLLSGDMFKSINTSGF